LGIIWLLPVFGPLLYLALGINRIRPRAISLGVHKSVRPIPQNLGESQPSGVEHLEMLARVVGRVVSQPLTPANRLQPLVNGDEAFPAMLAAIESATKSISLATYIFDNDASGKQFADALARAVKRGVMVRVLIDAAGTRYSFPSITHRLKHAKVPFAKFLPASLFTPWRVTTINLRDHRKIMIVDGRTAFTGGMNIRHGNVLADNPKSPVRDLHFRAEGPLVAQLQEAFATDWNFTTRETLEGEIWFPELEEHGSVVARAIMDGPDANFETVRWTLLAALAEAQNSVQIVTPYFLPDDGLITALNLAALRGVRVDIILPAKSNLRFVDWASHSLWWQVLERGCRIWLTRPPFDHSKLMIVDGHWVLFGSANWDARSLRLNFELNVEAYGRDFAGEMNKIIEDKLRGAREITLNDIDARSYAAKLRDAFFRLFSPYI
jgi:cardiolipin synthase